MARANKETFHEMCPDFMDTSYLVETSEIAEKASDKGYISSDVVTEYLNTIKHFDVLTPEEEKEYAERIRKGDKEARRIFIEHNTKLVIHAAKKKAKSPLEFADLIQAGNLGLIHAVDRYNPKRARFSTYAMYWILAYMIRSEENLVRPIRLPSYLVQIKTKVNKAKDALRVELGREPSIEELIKATGCNKKDVKLALKADYRMFSLNNEFGDEKENEGLTFFASEEDIEETVVDKIMSTTITKEVRDIITKSLSQKEQKVIIMRYFENCTFDTIGKALGISKQRVKKIESKALEIIKQHSIERGLHQMVK